MNPIIKAKDILFRYRQYHKDETVTEQIALDHVSLEIERGEFVGILGDNGCGKSTLAKHLAGLLFPAKGVVYVDGMNTSQADHIWDVRRTAGMIFQNPDNQLIGSSVEEDVAFGPENLGVETSEIRKRVTEALKAVGMSAYREYNPGNLSGGQKQRVALSGILAMNPACLILDEPTAMLDPEGRKAVLQIIHHLNKEEGMTIIYITHHVEEIADADRIYMMDHGTVVRQGRADDVWMDKKTLEEYEIPVPFPYALRQALKIRGIEVPAELRTREQMSEWLGQRIISSGDSKAAVFKEHFSKKEEYRRDAEQERCDTDRLQTVQESAAEETGDRSGITLRDIHFRYNQDSKKDILDGVNLHISRGEYVAIVGHTGSGKSTLLQHLNGLLKPLSGTYEYDGKDVWEKTYSRNDLRRNVALCFQFPEYQLFEDDVISDIMFGPRNMGLSEEECLTRAREAMRMTGLSEKYENYSPFALSGGQKRRVALAGILAMEPEYLVLDEPVAGLDNAGRNQLFHLLDELNQKGITLILVSHDMNDVAAHAKRVIVMNDGRIEMDGSPTEVFVHKQELRQMGLGLPEIMDFYLEMHRKNIQARYDNGRSPEKNLAGTVPVTMDELAESIEGELICSK